MMRKERERVVGIDAGDLDRYTDSSLLDFSK